MVTSSPSFGRIRHPPRSQRPGLPFFVVSNGGLGRRPFHVMLGTDFRAYLALPSAEDFSSLIIPSAAHPNLSPTVASKSLILPDRQCKPFVMKDFPGTPYFSDGDKPHVLKDLAKMRGEGGGGTRQ